MKRSLLALAALVCLVSAVVALPSFASARGDRGRTIDLTGVMTSAKLALDVKPAGDSAGDIGYVSGTLFKEGKPFGHYHGVCFNISAGGSQCTFTAGLPDGEILLEASYGPGYNTGQTAIEPITGGSGAYEGARGEVRDTEVGQTHLRMHIELLP